MANKRMLEAAARKFIRKVDFGPARSIETYEELKVALEAPEDTSDGPVDGRIETYYWMDGRQ